MNEKLHNRFASKFPYLCSAEFRESESGILSDRPAGPFANWMRFLSICLLSHFRKQGVMDDRVHRVLDAKLENFTLREQVEIQLLLLSDSMVPFREVFSPEIKSRELMETVSRRYFNFLTIFTEHLGGGRDSESSPTPGVPVSLLREFFEFVLTHFRSDLLFVVSKPEKDQEGFQKKEGFLLVNREKIRFLPLYPLAYGENEDRDLELFSGVRAGAVDYFRTRTGTAAPRTDGRLIEAAGRLLLELGAFRLASSLLPERDGEEPKGGSLSALARHCLAGVELFRSGKIHPAILELEKAHEQMPELASVALYLSRTYEVLKSPTKAMAVVKRVMQYQPELASGWELLGDICRNMEDFESAKQAYRRATQLNLENASVSAKLNRCLESEIKRQAKKSEEAKTAGEDKEPVKLTEEFLIDMSAEAERGAYHPILWRDREIEQIIEILSCKDRNSPLLIGEPGVGKTAIVEELARRIFSGEFPQTLAKKIFLMSVATLLAGAKFRGQFEERILQLIKELKKTDCILFIDDTHTIVNSGLTKGGVLDTSTLLKPALLRGEIQAIGATSYDEYRLNFEKDPSLVRCFQPVFIEEPTPEMMVDILRDTTARLAAFHGVEFDDVNFLELARLIKFCLKERKLPDIAINVFDRAAAKASLRRSARSKHEQESGPQETLPASAIVRLEDILEVISDLSGVPAQKLSADQNERFLKMESLLAERVVGQQEAIETVSGVIRTVKLNLDLQPHRPDGVFLFVGPSGVGKTELARALAEFLFGDESKLIRIDMSEYMEKIASSRLIGASPGYVGYNDQNQLTDMVRKNPYSLVLLDEIEKADAQMISIFLQVFDAGRLTDGKGRTVHFDNCTIIMTSNIGSHLYSQARVGYGEGVEDKRVTRGELRKEIRRFFSPEFLNRIDEVVFFNPLTLQDIKEIAKLQLKDVRARMEKDGVRLTISEGVLEKIAAEGFSPEYGARNLGRIIRKMILDPLAYKMLGRAERGVREVRVVMNGEAIEFGMLTETESRERASVELSEEAEPRVEKKENLP